MMRETSVFQQGQPADQALTDQALTGILRDNLPATLNVFGGLFIVFAISHRLVLPPTLAAVMSPAAAISAALYLLGAQILRRRSLPLPWVYPVTFAVVMLALGNSLLHLYLTADPLQTTNLLLVLIGVGFLLFSVRWWAAVMLLTLAGWVVIWQQTPQNPEWTHFGFAMLSAALISLVVQRVRTQDVRHMEGQRIHLSQALQSAEGVRRALEMTLDVGQYLTTILDLETLLNQVAEVIRQRYGYYYVGIFLMDAAGEYVVARAGTGVQGSAIVSRGLRLQVARQGIIGWVAQHRQAARVNDVTRDARYIEVPEIPLTRSELALPLEVNGRMLGVLDMQSERSNAFTEEDAGILAALARVVASAIQNASLYQVERSQRLLIEKLYDVGQALSRTLDLAEVLRLILKRLSDLVPFDRGAVMLERGAEMVFFAARGFPETVNLLGVSVPIKKDDVYRTIQQTQAPLLIPNVQERTDWAYLPDLPPARSWLGLPLMRAGAVFGMLSLTRERPDPYMDEEVQLAATFAGQAAVALENARLYDNLTQVNRRLETTIVELQSSQQQLKLAYAQLERLDRAKSDFINVASHELRTPITVLGGYSQILLDTPLLQNNESLYPMVEGIHSGTARLHKIVDSMLDMAKIDSRELQLRPEMLELAALLTSIHKGLKEALAQRGLIFTLAALDALPPIEADRAALRKMFDHLFNNAIKYTPDGGRITVTGRALAPGEWGLPEGGVEIVVSDTGIGIDPAYHEVIFAKFHQTGDVALHSSGDTKFKGGGPGLGLAIARGIVEAHGGKIWVESPGYDEAACPGSHFHVVLPRTSKVLLEPPQ